MRRYLGPLALAALALAVLPLLPRFLGSYVQSTGIEMLKWVALATSWYMFSSLTGYPSLAHGAFFGIGAYLAAVLWPKLPLIPLTLLGGLAAMAVALAIGVLVLRVKGPYFVVLTLGLNLFILHLMSYYEITVQGSTGRLLLGTPGDDVIYNVVAVLAVLAILAAWLIQQSRFGLGLLCIRQNEQTARAIGVNAGVYKWLAFGASAFFAGATGPAFALRWTFVDPGTVFGLDVSFNSVIMPLFGGQFSLAGPAVGAVILTLLREFLGVQFPRVYLIVLGLLLAVVVLFIPRGLLGLLPRRPNH